MTMKQYNIFGEIDHIEIINNIFKTKTNMINGFKIETKELTDYEMTLIPTMTMILSGKVGKEKALKNSEIISELRYRGFKSVTPPRIRKLVHYLRVNKIVTNLIATSKGYHRAETREELDNFIQSLQQRINSIDEVRKSFI